MRLNNTFHLRDLSVSRKDFLSLARIMRDISLQDLQKDEQQEHQGMNLSNPVICMLKGKADPIAERAIIYNAAESELYTYIAS